MHESPQVLGKAVSSEADAGVKEVRTDAGIQSNTTGDPGDVSPELFAEVGHHVDERNLGSQKGVGGMFYDFRRADGGDYQGTLEGAINLREDFSRSG